MPHPNTPNHDAMLQDLANLHRAALAPRQPLEYGYAQPNYNNQPAVMPDVQPPQAPRQEQPVPPPYDYDNPNGILDDDNFGRKPEKHDGGRGTAIKWLCGVITCAGIIGFVGYEVLHPSPKGHDTAATTELSTPQHPSLEPSLIPSPTGLPSAEPSVSPSETSLPTNSPTTSATPSSSPSPTSIPKFTLAGAKLDCASVATINVSESIPVAVSRKFEGSVLVTDNKTGIPDPNTYTFQAGPGADINVALSGTATLEVCVPDAAKLFVADPAAAAGTTAYTVDMKSVTTRLNPAGLSPTIKYATTKAETKAIGLQNGKRMTYTIGKNAPQFLADLCLERATAENAKKAPTPAEIQACNDVDPQQGNDWTDQAHQPVSALFNQMKNQISDDTKDIIMASTVILYGQLDKEQMQNMEAPVKTYLSAGLQGLAKEQGVPAQNVIVDQYSGDLASQQATYLAKYPSAKIQIASSLKTYILADKNVKTYLAKYPSTSTDLLNLVAVYQKQNPSANPFPFYADDSPNPSASITVTATEQQD